MSADSLHDGQMTGKGMVLTLYTGERVIAACGAAVMVKTAHGDLAGRIHSWGGNANVVVDLIVPITVPGLPPVVCLLCAGSDLLSIA